MPRERKSKKEIKTADSGNNKSKNIAGSGRKINNQLAENQKTNDRLWMQHFAYQLFDNNAIDEKQYRKLLAKIEIELNHRYKTTV